MKWISVEERLPEDGQTVVIYHPRWSPVVHNWTGWAFRDTIGPNADAPTHWMPLPEPPEE